MSAAEPTDDLNLARNGTWRNYDGTNGLPGPALAVGQDPDGFLWVGTYGTGVSRYDGEVFRTFSSSDGLLAKHIWSMLTDTRDGSGLLRGEE